MEIYKTNRSELIYNSDLNNYDLTLDNDYKPSSILERVSKVIDRIFRAVESFFEPKKKLEATFPITLNAAVITKHIDQTAEKKTTEELTLAFKNLCVIESALRKMECEGNWRHQQLARVSEEKGYIQQILAMRKTAEPMASVKEYNLKALSGIASKQGKADFKEDTFFTETVRRLFKSVEDEAKLRRIMKGEEKISTELAAELKTVYNDVAHVWKIERTLRPQTSVVRVK